MFDSSYERGRPLTFKIGVREVIQGWDMGILGTEGVPAMKEGGKRWENIVSVCGPQDVWARGGGDGGCCKGSLGVRYIHSMRDYVSHHASQWLVVVCHLYF